MGDIRHNLNVFTDHQPFFIDYIIQTVIQSIEEATFYINKIIKHENDIKIQIDQILRKTHDEDDINQTNLIVNEFKITTITAESHYFKIISMFHDIMNEIDNCIDNNESYDNIKSNAYKIVGQIQNKCMIKN